MKCPRCGHEMTLDTHRKYALNMCYECGYIEGRLIDPEKKGETNFERMKKLNFNEMVAFLTKGLNLDEAKLADVAAEEAMLRRKLSWLGMGKSYAGIWKPPSLLQTGQRSMKRCRPSAPTL